MCWRRFFCIVWPCRCRENEKDRTDELFAEILAVQARVKGAAQGVTGAANAQINRIAAVRSAIRERTEALEVSHPSPPTSEARERMKRLLDDTLMKAQGRRD